MALRKKEPLAGSSTGSLKRMVRQLEEVLNSGREAFRKKFPLFPLLEKPIIGNRPRQERKGKAETGQCPVYGGEEEYVMVEEGEPEGEEEAEFQSVAAEVRFPEKKAERRASRKRD